MRSWPATASRSAARKSWRSSSSGTHTLVALLQGHDTRAGSAVAGIPALSDRDDVPQVVETIRCRTAARRTGFRGRFASRRQPSSRCAACLPFTQRPSARSGQAAESGSTMQRRGGSVRVRFRGMRRGYRVAVGQAAIDPDAFNAFEARGWEDKAASYDRFVGDITSRFAEPLLNAVSAGPGTRLLDLATGPGYVAARAAEHGAILKPNPRR